jgi:peroxiredoxin
LTGLRRSMNQESSINSEVVVRAQGAIVTGAVGHIEAAKLTATTKPLTVGSDIPHVNILDLNGESKELHSIIDSKPTIIVFYRGGWCPFCNVHLADLGNVEKDLQDLGFQIIGISPDISEEITKTKDTYQLPYLLFSDTKAESMQKFGVAFRVDDATFTDYKDNYKIDLEKASGERHHILPVPSVFIVNSRGKITYVHSNPDFKVRMKGTELVAAAMASLGK